MITWILVWLMIVVNIVVQQAQKIVMLENEYNCYNPNNGYSNTCLIIDYWQLEKRLFLALTVQPTAKIARTKGEVETRYSYVIFNLYVVKLLTSFSLL